nr:peptide chain release factor N(5)-glutamine methyltransferase [Propionibacterium sp.]
MRPSAAIRATGLPAHEARQLLAHVLGVDLRSLPLVPRVSDADAAALAALAARRRTGEPLQHLTGRAFFRTVEVEVGPGVFVPRPETELLAGWALDVLRAGPGASAVVVELCAGSGAISRALATELPGPEYHAVELSGEAWPYLVRNLAGTGVRPVLADMAQALPELDGRVDLVVVNPPYVPESVRDTLPADVLHDPDLALFAGSDGLAALRVVVAASARLLRPGGWVGAEHDDTHGATAPALFAAHGGFTDIADHRDLLGRDRFVVARRAPRPDAGRMTP